jgi:hypothetical protein
MAKHAPAGPAVGELPAPPTLAHGAEDIFWVSHLHAALDSQGFHCGEEEMEAWLFEDQTLSALLTFQVRCPGQRLRLGEEIIFSVAGIQFQKLTRTE